MAVYPAGNPGAVPIDSSSAVGAFRNASGNTAYTLYDPDAPGWADFQYLSDAEITQLLVMSADSIEGAIGYWYLQLAGQAAIESKNIADYDLKISTEKRAADLRAQASFWLNLGGISVTGADYFDVVPTGTDETCWPELAERPFWGWP